MVYEAALRLSSKKSAGRKSGQKNVNGDAMRKTDVGAVVQSPAQNTQVGKVTNAKTTTTYCYWGFALSPALGAEAQRVVAGARLLTEADLPLWQREVFGLASQLVFAGVASYADSAQLSELPPLTPQVEPDEAVQAVGLALSLWVSRALQGRTLQEFRDLADFLGRSLTVDPASGQPLLAIPLENELEKQVHLWADRVREATDLDECRNTVSLAILSMAQAAVSHYYRHILENEPASPHLEQVMRFSAREVEKQLTELMDQLLPTFPQAHLAHMARYVEAQLIHADRPLPLDVATRGRSE